VFGGIRIAAPRAFVSIIGAEMLISVHGLGGLALQYGNSFQTARYFVPVTLVIATSLLVTVLLGLLERRLSRWRVT
jgi:ABC-type nitrate/sulfonate/bicarbonate transport system permease component